jgi:thiol-disulfide isomerase/thioredoxin
MTNAKKARQLRHERETRRRPARGSATPLWVGIGIAAVILVVVAVLSTGGEGFAGEPAADGTVTIAREAGPALNPGEPIPEWSAPSLDGSGTIRWSDFAGAPTVLTVWAPWCSHCQAELPRLAEALRNHPGVQLVTISTAVAQANQSSQGYLDSKGLSFAVAVDDAQLTLRDALGVASYPSVYFVNADGTVFRFEQGEIGLLPDGSVDPSVLDGMLGELEAANA